MSFKELIGKKIISLAINDQDNLLQFTIDDSLPEILYQGDKKMHYSAEGECCSDTFFYHVSNIEALIGGTVSSVDGEKETDNPYQYDAGEPEIDYDAPDYIHLNSYEHWGKADKRSARGVKHKDFKHGGYEEAGFWRLHTDKGTCTIEVRNAHNGYYGGRVHLMKDTDEWSKGYPYRSPGRKTDGYDLVPWKWKSLVNDM